jgi:hypothetical protein
MEHKSILYKQLASAIQARKNCEQAGNTEWHAKHSETIVQLVADFMPSGSGWDEGTKIDVDASHADKFVFYGAFHHMNDGGFYDGWTTHVVTVTPSLLNDFNIRISGRDRNDIKEYLHEMFSTCLQEVIVWSADKSRWISERYAQTGGEA